MLLPTSRWLSLIFAQLFCVVLSYSYIVETTEKLNGKSYVVRQDQPFFRVYHQPHFKVFRPPPGETAVEKRKRKNKVPSENAGVVPAPASKDDSKHVAMFGHHHLPKGERKDTAEWPLQLRPYLTCLDLNCQCQLFGGSLYVTRSTHSGAFCALSSGKVVKKAVRKEFRTLTKEERFNFITHMQTLKKNGMYNALSLIHRKSGVHSGPGFFPWHREFIKRLEMVYRMTDPNMQGLPYWDSTLDNNLPNPVDSVMFSEHLMGDSEKESGDVTSGPFAYWETMDVSRFLEFSHDYAHYFISGDMMERFSSSNDPLFIMHHGFVDSIWEMWRQKKQTRQQREKDYPANNGECMPEWHFSYNYMSMLEPMRNIDGLSNKYTDNLYEYAPRPTCKTGLSAECSSEFLFCDNRSQPSNPVCSSMVKNGGNCQGFEWSSEVCYQGQCIQGRCFPLSSANQLTDRVRKEGNSGGLSKPFM
uniref:Tyrosinase copper-binding domain-containing protein n=1 Tax=Ditylenchus dipsaci TaxID=166011 RepID=A0A915CSC3_9BILA